MYSMYSTVVRALENKSGSSSRGADDEREGERNIFDGMCGADGSVAGQISPNDGHTSDLKI